jgi:hypothetical protein
MEEALFISLTLSSSHSNCHFFFCWSAKAQEN